MKLDNVKYPGSVESKEENVSTDHVMNEDLKARLAEQLKNELSPLNSEIKKLKEEIVQQADIRMKKARQISKIHD